MFTFRQQLERLPRRQAEATNKPLPGTANSNAATAAQVVSQAATLVDIAGASMSSSSNNANSQFLLARYRHFFSKKKNPQSLLYPCVVSHE